MPSRKLQRWLTDRAFLLEVFAFSNLAFLVLDVWIAHSINDFRHAAEWIPVIFSAGGAAALLVALLTRKPTRGFGRWIGFGVGWGAVLVGLAGLVWHLESRFFEELTLKSLVYSAPFAAPLAFTGLGLLLLLNRLVPQESSEWGSWVVFFAWGGFVGNFFLAVFDHAQNGFFHATEWVAVASAAFAVSFLLAVLTFSLNRPLLQATAWVMGVQVVVGVSGFFLHLRGGLTEPGETWLQGLLYGAPVFAPLLFANLALLAGLGLWHLAAVGDVQSNTDATDPVHAEPATPSGRPAPAGGG